ncbi:capsule assembly Wzi family protein [Candidatus Poribacteria bacterium]|nr:capsule assembly Wzi family protein [Candidatus Poribacteria bacterium]
MSARRTELDASPGSPGLSSSRVRRAICAAVLSVCVWLPASQASSSALPDGVLDPTWSDGIDYLLTRGSVKGIDPTTQPWGTDAVRRALLEASTSTPFERALVAESLRRLPEPRGFEAGAELSLSYDSQRAPQAALEARVGLGYRIERGARLYQEWAVEPASSQPRPVPGGSTASHRTRAWDPFESLPGDGYVADFHRATVALPVGGIEVSVGRDPRRWGPGSSNALLLSDSSPPMDSASIRGTFGSFGGEFVAGALNTMWHDDGANRYLARRYFAAHRVRWMPSPRLQVGVMDAVLYGGDGRQPEWYYLNPLLPFYASQFNASTESNPDFLDDNAMIGFDARWVPRSGWALYGEALIDDFRYDPESDDPNALAGAIGFHHAGWRERGEFRAEYARIGRYTYTHLVQEQQYTHFGSAIGHSLGNDADELRLSGSWWLSERARVSLSTSQTRKGESTVADRFSGEPDTSFLAGVAETTRDLAVEAWARRGTWRARARAGLIWLRDADHEPGASSRKVRLSASATCSF